MGEVAVWANLRGVDSHGVLRIPSYVDRLKKKLINPTPDMRVEIAHRRHRGIGGGPCAGSGRDVAGDGGGDRPCP